METRAGRELFGERCSSEALAWLAALVHFEANERA
jgi:hypothetical protein